jgi:hypothetical protein
MATVTKSESNFASKADKPKRVLAPLTARIMDQLSKAVLSKKISKDELIRLSAHITKLEAFVET